MSDDERPGFWQVVSRALVRVLRSVAISLLTGCAVGAAIWIVFGAERHGVRDDCRPSNEFHSLAPHPLRKASAINL